jgi:hypothetical protein
MGRRDFQSTVADTLPKIIQENAKTGVGSIRFFKKDKKTVGKLYFRGGAIYAIELSTYTPSIVNRIATNEYINDAAREQVLAKFADNPADFNVVNFVLTRQLFPEKPLMGFIKDYFLDAFDELYTWDAVNVEWRTNDEPSPLVPTVPNVSPEDLVEKTLLRRKFLQDSVAQEWNTAPRDMGDLGFRKNYDLENQDYSVALILSIADGSWNISGAATYLGMSRFNLKKLVFELWLEGVVDMLHPSGLIITNRSPADIKTLSPKTQVAKVALPQGAQKNIFEESLPNTVENSPVSESAPIETIEENTKDKVNPPVPNQPPQFITHTAPAPFLGAATTPVAVVTPTVSSPEATSTAYSPSGDSNGRTSRISQLALQLKQEISELDAAIAAEIAQRQSMDSHFASLQTERNSFIEKINATDSKILVARQGMADRETEIKRLNEERDGITSLLK